MTSKSKSAAKIAKTEVTYLATLLSNFDERAAYEIAKDANNDSIQNTLKDLRESVNHSVIADLMSASNIDANFINRSERSNARFNVYSAEKVINVIRAALSVARLNHYSLHILRSVIACEKANVDFTQKDAAACCTLNAKLDASKAALLSQYEKHIALNTASTQSSSSLNALLICNVIRETRSAASVNVFKLAETEIAAKLAERI